MSRNGPAAVSEPEAGSVASNSEKERGGVTAAVGGLNDSKFIQPERHAWVNAKNLSSSQSATTEFLSQPGEEAA